MKDQKKKNLTIAFIAVFLAVSLAPLVLMPWFGNQAEENNDLSSDQGSWFLERLGDRFSKKFAFRRELVTAADAVKASIFGVSGQDGVVVGKKGYLFYKDSLDGFLGRRQLSDYQIGSLAYDLRLMQDELEEKGIRFIFTVAPNKNSLYPELMPQRYRPDIKARNITRLLPELEERGVEYLDLYSLFEDIDETMYLKGDSHWNNMGASFVADEISTALADLGLPGPDKTEAGMLNDEYKLRKDFRGDLSRMLYPAGGFDDEQIYYDKMDPDVYNERVSIRTVDDETGELKETDAATDPEWSSESEIYTENTGNAAGSILMIRDSFGNSLAPFMADKAGRAVFLNGTPYDLGRAEAEHCDAVVFEIVERNLDRIVGDAPVLSMTDSGLSEDDKKSLDKLVEGGGDQTRSSLTAGPSDSEFDYIYLTGKLDPGTAEETGRLYAVLKDTESGTDQYHALFRTNCRTDTEENGGHSEYGCSAYVLSEDIPQGEYDLYLAYEQNDSWHVSEKLGSFKQAE